LQELLKPIRSESLTEVFIKRFEEFILSGRLSIGQKLPSERELALQLGVSRPVVHEGLVDLAAKGLVTLIPRVGTIVNDYRREGSLALLTSLVGYQQGRVEPKLLDSLLDMRMLFEVEAASLAALNRNGENRTAFTELLKAESDVDQRDVAKISELDFCFHHLVALSSGNLIYPLLLNSFKQCYLNLAAQFYLDPEVVPVVFDLHRRMVTAIEAKNCREAADVMRRMLAHGAEHLTQRPGGREA